MFGQKLTNTNEILQWGILHCAKSATPDSAELNTAQGRGALVSPDLDRGLTCLVPKYFTPKHHIKSCGTCMEH
jgi:hypothetical protein